MDYVSIWQQGRRWTSVGARIGATLFAPGVHSGGYGASAHLSHIYLHTGQFQRNKEFTSRQFGSRTAPPGRAARHVDWMVLRAWSMGGWEGNQPSQDLRGV